MTDKLEALIYRALDSFNIELPSWGFANTGTRFGKFVQRRRGQHFEEKFADAGQVHDLTGACPTLALHVQWDLPNGVAMSRSRGLRRKRRAAGSINPNVFQDQEYKFGSLGNPDPAIRDRALRSHARLRRDRRGSWMSRHFSVVCGRLELSGHAEHPQAHRVVEEGSEDGSCALSPEQRLLIEYKPFEPAFYHTDIADWGMAFLLARAAGPQASVLVDTGHHYQAQNIEQIVAWLLHHDMLGGFHFNDRRYADDDLTLGSIDPYQIFRIFHEIQSLNGRPGQRPRSLSWSIRATTSRARWKP